MTIEIKRNAAETIIAAAGRLDTTTAPVLDKTISEDIEGTSAGLRVLLSAQKKMQQSGSMKVKNVCEEVMEILEMTGFADILVIE